MTVWIVSSCALIISAAAVREILGRRVPAGLRYALWLAVLVRLLVPGTAAAGPVSVMNIFPAEYEAETESAAVLPARPAKASARPAIDGKIGGTAGTSADKTPDAHIDVKAAAGLLWLCGSAAAALWFAGANAVFYAGLRRHRKRVCCGEIPLPVYITDGVASPCLFGFFRPSVYMPARASGSGMEYVTAHEYAHFRHGDNWWSLLRCACIAVWWWNPLVWWAASLSRSDGELACDEAVMKTMGPERRRAYGEALLGMIAVKNPAAGLTLAATGLVSGKREMKRRMENIVRKPEPRVSAAIAALLLMTVLTGCAFTGAGPENTPAAPTDSAVKVSLSDAELEYFRSDFFNNSEDGAATARNCAVADTFSDTSEVNLFQMFYNGTGYDDQSPLTDSEISQLGYSEIMTDVNRMTEADMNRALEENFGTDLDHTGKKGLDKFDYLPALKTYYHLHGDTNYMSVAVNSGYTLENDPDTVYLSCVTGFSRTQRLITLKKTDSGYRFVSNVWTGEVKQADNINQLDTVIPENFRLDYASGSMLIFHDNAGLFVYDIKKGSVTRSMDLTDPFGYGGIAVTVSGDGGLVQVRSACGADDEIYLCIHKDTAVYMETGQNGKCYAETPYRAMKEPAAAPSDYSFSGDTYQSLTLVYGGRSIKPFASAS
jgi:beta-lactamase regulating signal transducer with metallopeptidase domain